MATSTVSQNLLRGGEFLITACQPEDVFTPADLTDDQRSDRPDGRRIRHQGSAAGDSRARSAQRRLDGRSLLKKAGEIGLLGGGDSGSVRRRGPRQSFRHRAGGKASRLRVVRGFARRARGHRHDSHRLFRHRRAEEKIPAEDCDRRIAFLLLPLRAAGRLGCAGRAHARCSFARRQELDSERPEDVDHQRRIRRPVSWCSPKWTARNFPASSSSAATPGFSVGAEEKKMGIKGSSTVPIFFENCPVPKENLLHEIGRGHIVAFNTLNAGRFSLGAYCLGGAKKILEASSKYSKERTAFGKPFASSA